MNAEQIKLLEETIDHKNSKIPVALIADSPWIPGRNIKIEKFYINPIQVKFRANKFENKKLDKII